MDVASQFTIRELDERVAEIHNAVARQRFDVAPAMLTEGLLGGACAVFRRRDGGQVGWQTDLQAAQAIEEHSHRAEICVLAQRDAGGGGFLGWSADEPDLVAAWGEESVDGGETAVVSCPLG